MMVLQRQFCFNLFCFVDAEPLIPVVELVSDDEEDNKAAPPRCALHLSPSLSPSLSPCLLLSCPWSPLTVFVSHSVINWIKQGLEKVVPQPVDGHSEVTVKKESGSRLGEL